MSEEFTTTYSEHPLSKFLSINWDSFAQGRTITVLSKAIGYKTPNMLSMVKAGRMKVPLEKLPVFARVFNIDIALLIGLWLEGEMATRDEDKDSIRQINERIVRGHELHFIRTLRSLSIPEDISAETVEAIQAVISDSSAREAALKSIK